MSVTMEDLAARLQRLEDLEAIRQLKHRYAALCDDSYNPEGLASLWVEDGVWDAGPGFGRYEGPEAIKEFFAGISDAITWAAHLVLNEMIDLAEDGRSASATWWIIEPHTLEGTTSAWIVGRYIDDYVKVDGEWKFKSLKAEIHVQAPHLTGWAEQEETSD